jgi:uncharacterized protein with ParB-like and HNH nuclease domain
MKTPKHSLRKIVAFLNNPEEEGGFWLPNIQRPFVWSEEQMCRLFDSILREYPISTLLIWKTRSPIRRRKFIDNFHRGLLTRLSDFYVPEDDKKKCLVLDGQQRLQSLYIGLCGSYEGRELYIDILSGEVAAPDDVKYKFAFHDAATAAFPWFKFKDIVFSPKTSLVLAQQIIRGAGRELTDTEQDKVSEHVALIFKTFHSDDGIAYQELDSIENKELYSEEDVVEVFIRANSGGTRLGKSDLLFSLLTSSWDHADEEMEDLLAQLNQHGFAFPRDFVLKTCLTLLGQGARYEVDKFRKPGVRDEIESKWDDISKAVRDVIDFVRGKTFIRCDKAMPSNLVLIPLIYVRYHFPQAWKQAKDVDRFLLRSLLAGAFSGTPDQLIDDLVTKIKQLGGFDVNELFDVIRSKGRSLELTEDRFWQMGYGSETIHLLFNLWYRDFHYTPAYENNLPQIDHIFPQSALRKVKVANPRTGRKDLVKYKDADRNQLANCMLLTQQENGAGGKSDTVPLQWFAGKDTAYFQLHLIPQDPELWKMDRFEDFVSERKKLIRQQFAYLLSSAQRIEDESGP